MGGRDTREGGHERDQRGDRCGDGQGGQRGDERGDSEHQRGRGTWRAERLRLSVVVFMFSDQVEAVLISASEGLPRYVVSHVC